jgi:TolB protein
VSIEARDIPVATETGYPAQVESTLEILYLGGTQYGPDARRVIRHFDHKIEAPNWTRDGAALIYNDQGLIYRIGVEGRDPTRIDTGPLTRNNNDHGVSPDGAQLIVSDNSGADGRSRIHILPITGSASPREVVSHPEGYSYWHAWTPDGQTIAYTANRPEFNGDYDIYSKPLNGGPERNLTRSQGLDDGPDYSPDGQWLYFNSTRSGDMRIWRMAPDGSNPEMITHDAGYRDWFPHPSPDGKWIIFISFGMDIDLSDHPPNRDVMLRIMPADGSAPPRIVTRLFGGQGTINVPSWSPDSTRFAFVSYRLKDGKPPVR